MVATAETAAMVATAEMVVVINVMENALKSMLKLDTFM